MSKKNVSWFPIVIITKLMSHPISEESTFIRTDSLGILWFDGEGSD